MRNEQLDALYPATPDGFHLSMTRAAESLAEQAPARRPLKWVMVCAVIGALLVGTLAYAVAVKWGVLDFLSDYAPTEGAKDIVQTGLNAHSAMAGDVKFELTDAAYDGEQIYLSLKMSAKDRSVLAWSDGEAELYASVTSVAVNGQEADFWPTEGQARDGAVYTMIGIPFEAEDGQEAHIELKLSVYHEDSRAWDEGELTYRMPVRSDASRVLTVSEPIAMNGVTVTRMRFTYSPLKMYAQITYEIDPDLTRFERLRREAMFFSLAHDGEPLNDHSGQIGPPDENGVFTVNCELDAASEPYGHLTVTFEGRDGEVYWEHTIDFEEAGK